MKIQINVLSDCDGISCGQEALKQMGFNIKNYYASEKESNPIKVTNKRSMILLVSNHYDY